MLLSNGKLAVRTEQTALQLLSMGLDYLAVFSWRVNLCCVTVYGIEVIAGLLGGTVHCGHFPPVPRSDGAVD